MALFGNEDLARPSKSLDNHGQQDLITNSLLAILVVLLIS